MVQPVLDQAIKLQPEAVDWNGLPVWEGMEMGLSPESLGNPGTAKPMKRRLIRQFIAALDKLRKGSLTCVFDATDRIQHMFWRYIEPGHPAARGNDGGEHRDASSSSGRDCLDRHREKLGRTGTNLSLWFEY